MFCKTRDEKILDMCTRRQIRMLEDHFGLKGRHDKVEDGREALRTWLREQKAEEEKEAKRQCEQEETQCQQGGAEALPQNEVPDRLEEISEETDDAPSDEGINVNSSSSRESSLERREVEPKLEPGDNEVQLQREERQARLEQEKAKAEQERAKAEQEKAKAEQEKAKAEQEKLKVGQERAKDEQETAKAELAMIKMEAAKAERERINTGTKGEQKLLNGCSKIEVTGGINLNFGTALILPAGVTPHDVADILKSSGVANVRLMCQAPKTSSTSPTTSPETTEMPEPVPDVVVATMHPKPTVPMPLPETRPAPESRPVARLVVDSMDSRVVAMTAVPTPAGPGPFPITATTTTKEPKAKKAKSGEMALKTKATTTTTTTEPKAKKAAKSGEMALKTKATTTTTTEPKAKKAAKSGEIAQKTNASTAPLMKDIAKPTSRPVEECKITWERPAQGPAPGPCRTRLSTRGRRKRTTTTTPYDKKSSNREASPQPSTSGYVPPTRRPNPPPPATRQREAITHISESEDEDVRQTPQKLATVCRVSPMAPKTQELNAEDILSSQTLNAVVELFSENQSLAMEELGLATIDMFTTQFEPVEGFDDEVSDLFECGQRKFYEPDYVEPTPTMDLFTPTMHEAALLSSGVMRKLN
ncbi:uncharacterized protein [Procambarus clarkii]|uniref:uncharacterized protein n=1 Tax=Procambarus clarkii TaxID=6728 RepID=UPI00374456E5